MRLDIKDHRHTAVADPLRRAGEVDDDTSWPPQRRSAARRTYLTRPRPIAFDLSADENDYERFLALGVLEPLLALVLLVPVFRVVALRARVLRVVALRAPVLRVVAL
jgi:hypothetical protein